MGKLEPKNSFTIRKKILRYLGFRGVFYSQRGEDVIVFNYLCNIINKKHIVYLDLGCGQPKFLSNTYLLYKNGHRGICYDADPHICKKFKKARPEDKVYNYAISNTSKPVVNFYQMNLKELSNTNKLNTQKLIKNGFKIENKITVNACTVNQVINKINCNIDFISLDIEGGEECILHSLNWDTFMPSAICVEVVDQKNGENASKALRLIRFL